MSDTQWRIWEVLHQQSRGEPHVHVGSVHAPDAEMALVMAKEQFGRRQGCVNLWVVAAEDIHATEYEDADIFVHATDKSYREAFGYDTTKKIRAIREQQKTQVVDEALAAMAKARGLTTEQLVSELRSSAEEMKAQRRALGLPEEGPPPE